MIVVGCDRFSEMLAAELRWNFVRLEYKLFPDGESYFRLTEQNKLKGQNVVAVIRGETPGFNPDKLVTEALFVLERISQLKPKKVCCLLPYQPYARQDKEFLPGEPVTAMIVRKMLTEKCDLLINVAAHDFRKEGWIGMKMYNVDGIESVISFLKTQVFSDPVVMAPDMAENENAKRIADAIGAHVVAVEKERDKLTNDTTSKELDYDFGGKDVIIYDDISSSGGTVIKAMKRINKDGPRSATVVLIHAISCHNPRTGKETIGMIKETGAKLYSSDAIQTPVTSFSVVPEIASRLKRVFG
jgi:ribose-phosphate pyrophosphokinase